MNELFSGYCVAESNPDRRQSERDTGGDLEPGRSALSHAKARMNAEFDRVCQSIRAATDGNAGLHAIEIKELIELVEEKRSEQMMARMSLDWVRSWQWSGRAYSVLLADSRARAIYRARDERRHVSHEMSLRYFGFMDEHGCRIFSFGPLPESEISPKYHVHVPLSFFSPGRMLLQDGPGFCAALLSRQEQPNDCAATLEHLDCFLAARAAKTANKARKPPRRQPEPEAAGD